MMRGGKGLVLQDLDRLFRRGTVPAGDGALLDSFLSRGDESAFEALVGRHGPMVRGVCRRLLASPHDADDAFQATFLVLVRKGGRLRDPDRLGPWLHGVATREALKARAARREDRTVVDVPCREGADAGAEWSDVMPIIDAELARLPAKHREVLVACLLDGATVEEASRRLDCPVGTVKSRLSRAREILRARLTSRGVAPAVAASALAADSSAFASPVSSTLIRATLAAASARAAAPGAASFLTGVAPTMISKSTLSALAVVGLGVAGLGVAAWNQPSRAQGQPTAVERPRAAASAPGETDEARRQALNLKEILLASANYASRTGHYPPPAIYGDGNYPLLSWRVAILPFLGQNELYQQFRMNEPWDSPHNKALIDRMPAVFETPASPTPKGYTRFRGVAGKGSVFDPTLESGAGPMGGMMSSMPGMRGRGGMMGGMGAMMGGMGPMGGMGAMSGHGQAAMMDGRGMMDGMMGGRGMMDGMMGGRGMMGAKKGTDKRRVAQAEEAESHRREMQSRLTGKEEPQGQPQQGAGQSADRPEERPGAAAPAGSEGAMGGMMGMMMAGMGAASPTSERRGVQVAEIADGTANTILAVVARDATPWTKPGELPFVPDQELPALDDHDPRGYMLGMCHGNVRVLKKDHPSLPMILAALITRSGGEVVSADVFADEARPPAAAAPGSLERSPTAAPGSSSVEERLRAVEEKLDRLIERLDAR